MVGTVYEEITLKNDGDKIRVQEGLIKEPDMRKTTVRALVDTGAETLVINEAVQKELGLRVKGLREAFLANNEKVMIKITETVEVWWKDRFMTCQAWVIPNAKEVLLGAIPLEDMDLMVNPVDKKLVGVHGDKPVSMVM
jgi:clan AA aspartic protease